jgi:nucleotide-binding universal stress UspA family protein
MNPKTTVQYNRILFCTDFSENAHFAFHYALASAQRTGHASLYILHVLPEPDAQFWQTYLYEVDDVDAKAHADINAKIETNYLSEIPSAVAVTVAVRKGKAEQEIMTYAREMDADLLVIGRQGSSSLGKHLFGNVAEIIARKANCPVLIVPFSYEKKVEHS